MASEKITALIEEVKALTVLELSELVKALEEEFGVSAAAMTAPAAGAAAAAKAWSEAQGPASSRAELSQFKAAGAHQEALEKAEGAKKAALAAAAKASAQQGHIAAIKAQTSEIKANTARNIAAQENPVEFAQGMPAEVKQDVQDAAQASQENAQMQEQINYLPEVQVKSDFSKYLLWGGVAVLAFYLLKKKKRG